MGRIERLSRIVSILMTFVLVVYCRPSDGLLMYGLTIFLLLGGNVLFMQQLRQLKTLITDFSQENPVEVPGFSFIALLIGSYFLQIGALAVMAFQVISQFSVWTAALFVFTMHLGIRAMSVFIMDFGSTWQLNRNRDYQMERDLRSNSSIHRR